MPLPCFFWLDGGRRSPLQLEEPEGKEPEPGASTFAPKTLLPFMKRLPVKRVVHVANATEDPVRAASNSCRSSQAASDL